MNGINEMGELFLILASLLNFIVASVNLRNANKNYKIAEEMYLQQKRLYEIYSGGRSES